MCRRLVVRYFMLGSEKCDDIRSILRREHGDFILVRVLRRVTIIHSVLLYYYVVSNQ
jgi:hypothetical protein